MKKTIIEEKRIEHTFQKESKKEDFDDKKLKSIFETEFFLHDPDPYKINLYFPELPKEGSWIMIRTKIPVNLKIPITSIYYAKLKPYNAYKAIVGVIPKLAQIVTMDGETCSLFEHEYSIIKDITKYYELLDNKNATFNFYAKNGMIDDKDFKEKFNYILSRGIGRGEATKMLLGNVNKCNVGYIRFNEEYEKIFTRY